MSKMRFLVACFLLFVLAVLQTSSANEISTNQILIIENQKYLTSNEIEKQFENNEKVSVIIMQKPQKSENIIKTFDFQSNSVEFGAQSFSKQDFEVKTRFSIINAFSAEITKKTYEQLQADENILIQYDHPMHAFLQGAINITNISRLQLAQARMGGAGQTICIVDTGINYNHADLGGCFGAGCKVSGGYDFVNSDANPIDDNGHGTHVAGIAAANGSLKGAAPDAGLAAVKVLDAAGNGAESDIISGIQWCVDNRAGNNISVISMSLGSATTYGSYCDASFSAMAGAVNNAIAVNISVLAATGNAGSTSQISSPACITNVTAVGATYKNNSIASYSNRATFVNLFAPGDSINSTYNSGYAVESGTSMATPLVAGSFALARQAYQNKYSTMPLPAELLTAFNNTGVNITDAIGTVYRRINVLAALSTFDTQNPQYVLNSPANNSVLNRSAAISISFTDDIGIYRAYYSRNGTANVSTAGQISTLSWPAGNNTLTLHVWDVFDKYNTTEFRFDILATPPIASNVTITPSAPYANSTLLCNYTYSDANGDAENSTAVIWYLNGAENSTFANSTAVNSTYLRKNQTWQCAVQPCDGIACGTTVNSTAVTVQSFAVVLNSTTVSSGKVNSTILINATVIDVDTADIINITAYYQNLSQTTLIGSDITNPYSISWNTSLAGDGNYTVIVNATDGSASSNKTVQDVFVDNNRDAPMVNITSPNGGESWSGTQTVAWTASDADYDLLNFTIYYTSEGVNWTKIADTTSTAYSWDTANVANGVEYKINITATDGIYNVSDISNGNFTISNTAGNPSATGGSSGGGGGGGLGGGKADPNKNSFLFLEIAKDSSQSISISAKIAATDIEFTVTEAVQNARVAVKKTDGPAIPAKETFAYFEVDTTNLDNKIKGAKITFRVDPKWLKDNNIDKKTVSLYRYSSGWQKLDTYLVRADDIDAVYYANSPGFSTFGIAGEKASAPAPAEEKKAEAKQTTELSGFSATSAAPASGFSFKYVVFAIALVLAVLLAIAKVPVLMKRHKSLKPRDLKAEYVDYQKKVQEFYKNRSDAVMAARRKQIEARQATRSSVFSLKSSATRSVAQRTQDAGQKTGKSNNFIKWLFTDTKVAKEQEKKEKSSKKERPDFGF
ncbi:MAG: S8 family serine peptidase [Nanoarchaeota archaeon]